MKRIDRKHALRRLNKRYEQLPYVPYTANVKVWLRNAHTALKWLPYQRHLNTIARRRARRRARREGLTAA